MADTVTQIHEDRSVLDSLFSYSGKPQNCRRCLVLRNHTPDNFRAVTEIRRGAPYRYIKHICYSCEKTDRVAYGQRERDLQNARRRETYSYDKNRDACLRKYGIRASEYDQMLKKQGGVCAICKGMQNGSNGSGTDLALSVDHNHRTGAIRALLCASCNAGIGCFRESPDLLEMAIEYLEQHHGG